MADDTQDTVSPDAPSDDPGQRWKVKSIVHRDSQGNVITAEQQKQLEDAHRHVLEIGRQQQQKSQQEQQKQQFLQQHPEAQARVIEAQEKAKFDAENFEKRYTTEQKAKLAQSNVAMDNWKQMHDRKEIDDDTFQKGYMSLQMQKVGIVPSEQPRLSPDPKGQGARDIWKDKDGEIWNGRDASGAARHVPYEKTAAGAQRLAIQKLHMEELRQKAAEAKATASVRKSLLFDETMKDGVKTRRLRKPEEIDAIMKAYSGQKPQPDPKQQQAQQAAKKSAQSFIEKTMQRYGSFAHVPPELQDQLRKAAAAFQGNQQSPQQQQPEQNWPQSPGEPVAPEAEASEEDDPSSEGTE